MSALRIGTRGSPLALWQAERVKKLLCGAHPDLDVEVVVVKTRAESFPERSLADIGAGVFTKELDDALTSRTIDVAVHSAKDVPSQLPPELHLASFPERASPRDAFVGRDRAGFSALPPGARIGTGSPRRRAQLLGLRPDIEVVPIRGNVDTRLAKVKELDLAGTILAEAGLARLGRREVITEVLSTETLIPAVGQGAIALATRRDDDATNELVRAIDDPVIHLSLDAERGFLATLRGGCQVPAGAFATVSESGAGGDGGEITLRGVIAQPDGASIVRGERRGPTASARELGVSLAEELLTRGGDAILRELRGDTDA